MLECTAPLLKVCNKPRFFCFSYSRYVVVCPWYYAGTLLAQLQQGYKKRKLWWTTTGFHTVYEPWAYKPPHESAFFNSRGMESVNDLIFVSNQLSSQLQYCAVETSSAWSTASGHLPVHLNLKTGAPVSTATRIWFRNNGSRLEFTEPGNPKGQQKINVQLRRSQRRHRWVRKPSTAVLEFCSEQVGARTQSVQNPLAMGEIWSWFHLKKRLIDSENTERTSKINLLPSTSRHPSQNIDAKYKYKNVITKGAI